MNQLVKPRLTQAKEACRSAFLYVGLFSLFINIFMLVVPIYMLQIFDRVLASHSYETLIYLTLIAIFALLILGLLDLARSRIFIRVGDWLDQFLSAEALFRCADEVLMGRSYGTQALRDITNIRQFLTGSPIFAFFDSPWVPIYIAVIFLLHPTLGLISLIGAVVIFSLALTNEIVTREPLKMANALNMQNTNRAEMALRNAEAIQAMGIMPNIVGKWYGENQKALYFQRQASRRGGLILSASKFIRLTLQLLILGVGAYYVVLGEISPGVMIAASILMSRALAPVEQSIGAWKQMLSAREAYGRLSTHFEQSMYRVGGIKLPTPTGAISLDNVYYVPPNSKKPVLHNVTYRIAPGELLAIIGPTAAGKSTLARLLTGAWRPTTGNVRLDGADIYFWDRTDFGKHVGYLPQDVELFDGDVKENICRLGEVDDEAIVNAAKLAGVHELILHLPNGYETMIGQSGYQLSAGQRQRIALARAVYGNPKLVVLDEPNSNLDHEGEVALENALAELKARNTTIVIIAHRPSAIKHADNILVLNSGTIQFSGPRDEILGKMQQIARSQQHISNEVKQNGA